MSSSSPNRPLHLLSLDGGGVRGLSSIRILRHLMGLISKQRGRDVQPWEEFDMIGGTSTGGLIAIMLGRLRMSLDECENAYLRISERIFAPKRLQFDLRRSKDFLLANGKFDSKGLGEAVKKMIGQVPGLDESSLLRDPDPQCKVFVCATRTSNSAVALMRSYETTEPELLFDECQIWEACRATTAAPTLFDPIKIGRFGQSFADGRILYNNPIQLLKREAEVVWPLNRTELAVFVSIGTGNAPGCTFGGNLWQITQGMERIVSETEKTHNDFFRSQPSMVAQRRFFRFNVPHGFGKVGLEGWKGKEQITNATETYLETGEVQLMAKLCVEQLCELCPVVESSVDNNARIQQRSFSEQDLSDCIRSLSFEHMDTRQHGISLAHRGTCDWIFNNILFRKWMEKADLTTCYNRTLWIKGHPGVGKSTLMKHTLLYCQEQFVDHVIAYHFFNARGNDLERCFTGMIRSLLVHLLEKDHDLQQNFLSLFLGKKRRHGETVTWSIGELKQFILREYRIRKHNDTIIFIDALDECGESGVREIVNFLEDLSMNARQSRSNFWICLSSRHYPNIDMKSKIELVVEHQVEHDKDIAEYVQEKLTTTNKIIQSRVLEKAQHIFMWAVLVVQLLNNDFCKGLISEMWKKLDDLPTDLDQLFSTLLEDNQSEEEKKKTVIVFQWVLFSERSLSPEELYFAMLAETEPNELGAWDPSHVDLWAIERYIINVSKGLVEIVVDTDSKGDKSHGNDASSSDKFIGLSKTTHFVQFIHQSVIDFLMRNQRLAKLHPSIDGKIIGTSHDRLASSCMVYIMQDELRHRAKDILERSEPATLPAEVAQLYPFLDYASKHLLYHAEHAQKEGVSQVELLRPLHGNGFAIFQLFHDSARIIPKSYRISGAQLLYALCFYGCRYLLPLSFQSNVDINAQGGHYGSAFQAAAVRGHGRIIELLLRHDADVNIRGGYEATALRATAYRDNKMITRYKADVDLRGGFYGSALQAAAIRGHEGIINLLLRNHADVNIQGGYYGTALQAAVSGGHKKIIEILLGQNADVNLQSGYFGTPLQAAAFQGDILIVELLLRHNADVNLQGGYYQSALQAAASRGRTDIIQLLLEHDADVNIEGGNFGSALQAAAYQDRIEIVELLLKYKVNVNASSGNLGTALEITRSQGRDDIIDLLLDHGALETSSVAVQPLDAASALSKKDGNSSHGVLGDATDDRQAGVGTVLPG